MKNNNRESRSQKLEYRSRTQPINKIEPQRTQSIFVFEPIASAKGEELFLTTNSTDSTNKKL